MANKRGNNEGTIHKRANGTFRVQITIDGIRQGKTFKTRRECQEWLKRIHRQVDDGISFRKSSMSLEKFLGDWLLSKKSSLRPRTWSQYQQIVSQYLKPALGKAQLSNLRSDQIQRFYDGILRQGTGVFTVRKIHTVLHSALTRAVKLGYLAQNPASAAQPPQDPQRELPILDEIQVNRLLFAAREDRLEALYYLAVTTGMRQMELLGLQWSDLDWARGTINVQRQLRRTYGPQPVYSSPKTKNGRRTIKIGSNAVDVLQAHHQRQHADRIEAGERWREYGLIFTNSVGGPIDARNLLRRFKKLLNIAGLPDIRFHDLRHTAASLMLNNNVPPIVVSRNLGHARPSITLNIYGHLIPAMQTEYAELMDELVTSVELKPEISQEV